MSNNEITNDLIERLRSAETDLCNEAADRLERLNKHRKIARKVTKRMERLLEEAELQIQMMATALRSIRNQNDVSVIVKIASVALKDEK